MNLARRKQATLIELSLRNMVQLPAGFAPQFCVASNQREAASVFSGCRSTVRQDNFAEQAKITECLPNGHPVIFALQSHLVPSAGECTVEQKRIKKRLDRLVNCAWTGGPTGSWGRKEPHLTAQFSAEVRFGLGRVLCKDRTIEFKPPVEVHSGKLYSNGWVLNDSSSTLWAVENSIGMAEQEKRRFNTWWFLMALTWEPDTTEIKAFPFQFAARWAGWEWQIHN
ncbi:hypothetical protein C8F04DRAFT_1186540 [Mycena alexandri]|uniref:Uncharacterized protein n=1 Tax=Mycena alexandri TaxID=1745969 RepID=A0AAD6SMX1_9AGAR|nr:hypothetical protein C8F04DRAFT_1186540 [Mycena alexandri]